MLHKRYPEASARAMEVVHDAMTDGFEIEGVAKSRRAFVKAEDALESEGFRKADGKRFSYAEIPFLMNWGKP